MAREQRKYDTITPVLLLKHQNMTKKILLLPLLLIAIVFTGCNVNVQYPELGETLSTNTYENSEFNFSIEFPSSAIGASVNVDNDPIPPEATQTIGFLLNGDGFFSIEIYELDAKENYGKDEMSRSRNYVYVARQTSGGNPLSYRLSDKEFEDVKNSFKFIK